MEDNHTPPALCASKGCNYTSLTYSAFYDQLRRNQAVHAFGTRVPVRRRIQSVTADVLQDPEAGAVIPGAGGVRKLRWGIAGRGKRGGLRVIYFVRTRHGQIWMLTMYPKNVTENISAHVLRKIRDEIDD